jgi:CMP-N-acetylneuraminic acid synthetase
MKKLECLGLILARGGSKGVPRKNLRPLAGKPLVLYGVHVAQAAQHVTRVAVSTDDAEIADVARAAGALVIPRPAELASDTASAEVGMLHALDWLREKEGYAPDLLSLIQCTSPFTLPEDIDGVIECVHAGADSAFTANPFWHFVWRRNADGTMRGVNHSGANRLRRQDLEPEYLENGSAYAMRVSSFRNSGDRFCGKVTCHVMPPQRGIEIDTPEEFALCEALMATLVK